MNSTASKQNYLEPNPFVMNKNIAVIQGDGIGPEVVQQSIKVLDAIADRFNHEFNYTYCLMGAVAIDKTGNP